MTLTAAGSKRPANSRTLADRFEFVRERTTWIITAAAVLLAAAGVFGDSANSDMLKWGGIAFSVTLFGFVLVTRDKVLRIHDELVPNNPVQRLVDGISYLTEKTEGIQVSETLDLDSYYRALQRFLAQAEDTVLLTQIRDETPDEQGIEAVKWQSALEDWLGAKPGRVVKRVMSTPNDSMKAWAASVASKYDGRDNFQIRRINGESGVPAINFAVFDKKAVLMAISGATRQQGRGVGIEHPNVCEYFAGYFERLFDNAEKVNRTS